MKTREEWMQSAVRYLEGVFAGVKGPEDPILPEKMRARADGRGRETDTAEAAEGLVRTFCLAAAVIREEPEIRVHGIGLREYYARWILRLCAPEGEPGSGRAGFYGEDRREISQITVECGLLTVALWLCEEEIWLRYTKEERGRVAAFLASYAAGKTVMQNWRLFVMVIGAFLRRHGYPCDRERMHLLAEEVQIDAAGGGWYRDGAMFDYYTAWGYQIFLAVWNLWYGYDEEPELAERFEAQLRAMVRTYELFFREDGRMILWGRSGIYRAACAAPLIGTFLLPGDPGISPGRARQILDGLLEQFSGLEGAWLPLGYEDAFPPMVQSYSRTASPYWMSMFFWCLYLPEDHPLWTTAEPCGQMNPHTEVLDGPGIAATRLAGGSAMIRTGKVTLAEWNDGMLDCYAKLAYHSDFVWGTQVQSGDVIAEPMQYRILTGRPGGLKRRILDRIRRRKPKRSRRVNAMLWCGMRGDVLLRRAFFGWKPGAAWEWTESILLADVAMPCGILRADRLRCPERPLDVTLGSFSVGGVSFDIERRHAQSGPAAEAVIVRAVRPGGEILQMAMTAYGEWDGPETVRSEKTTPENLPCVTAYVRRRVHPGSRKNLLITQVIGRLGENMFSDEELFPVREVVEGVRTRLALKDGRDIVIPYDEMSGTLQV